MFALFDDDDNSQTEGALSSAAHHLSDLGADAVFKSIFTCVFLQSAGENIMINSVRADGPAVWLTWISSVSVS